MSAETETVYRDDKNGITFFVGEMQIKDEPMFGVFTIYDDEMGEGKAAVLEFIVMSHDDAHQAIMERIKPLRGKAAKRAADDAAEAEAEIDAEEAPEPVTDAVPVRRKRLKI